MRTSHIPPLDGEGGPGPSLGRPALVAGDASVFTLPTITDPETIEGEVASAINQPRRRRGLAPLVSLNQLARAGDAHARSLALAGAFTHDWPLTPRARFARWIERYYGPPAGRVWRVGENLLWSEAVVTPGQAVAMWLNSPSHRGVMLSPDWRELGIGVVRADGAGGVFSGRNDYVVAAEFGAR